MIETEMYVCREVPNKRSNETRIEGICDDCGNNCTHILVTM